jgi:Lipid A core - O-antigen ligase and related enzymes
MKIKLFIAAILLVLPMISRWLLPYSLETLLMVNFLDNAFYIPNICYLIYMLIMISDIHIFKNKKILTIYVIFSFSFFLSWCLNDYSDRWSILFFNQAIVLIPIIMLLLPLYNIQIKFLKYIFLFTLLILILEIILYSLGIFEYEDLSGGEFSGIFRINTTIGASTGTGVIVFMLGAFVYENYIKNSNKIFIFLFFILWVTSIFFTVSRGSILSILLLLIVITYKNIINFSLKKRLFFISSIILLFCFLNYLGVFEPILERQNIMIEENDVTSGREIRQQIAINIFNESPLYGVGNGNVYPSKELMITDYPSTHAMSPHNFWLTILAENGILGLIILFIFYVSVMKRLNYEKYTSWAIIITIVVLMNVENVFIHDEYIALFFLLIISSLKNKQHKSNLNYSDKNVRRLLRISQ